VRQAARYQSPAPASPGEAGDRNPPEPRSKPRFPLFFICRKGQAAGYSSSRENGTNKWPMWQGAPYDRLKIFGVLEPVGEYMTSIKNVQAIARTNGRHSISTQARQYSTDFYYPEYGVGSPGGPTSLEYFFLSIAVCCVSMGMIIAAQHRMKIRSMEAMVDGDLDLDVVLGKNEKTRPGFTKIQIHYRIDADLTADQKKAFLEEIYDKCPIIDTIKKGTQLEYSLE
jgi:uncharacterized OsmC-like protein